MEDSNKIIINDDNDDIWNFNDDCNNDIIIGSKDVNVIIESMRQSGYRQGRQEEDDRQGQLGFNEGLTKGFKHGNMCGNLYSHCMLKINEKLKKITIDTSISNTSDKVKLEQLKTILYRLIFELIPEKQDIDHDILNHLKDTVLSIDQDLLEAYQSFATSLTM